MDLMEIKTAREEVRDTKLFPKLALMLGAALPSWRKARRFCPFLNAKWMVSDMDAKHDKVISNHEIYAFQRKTNTDEFIWH